MSVIRAGARFLRNVVRKMGIYISVCMQVHEPWVVFLNQMGRLEPGMRTLTFRNGLAFRCRHNSPDFNEAIVVGLAHEYPSSYLTWLAPGAVVLDLGAHIGSFAILTARLRPDVTVHAYEASSENVGLLEENVALNGVASQIVVHHAAVGRHDGRARLSLNAKNDSFHVVTAAIDSNTEDVLFEDVPSRSLRSILGDIDASRIDLLKMDIEGGEYAVLESSACEMAKCKTILMEWHQDPAGDHNHHWLVTTLQRLGFEVSQPHARLIVATDSRSSG